MPTDRKRRETTKRQSEGRKPSPRPGVGSRAASAAVAAASTPLRRTEELAPHPAAAIVPDLIGRDLEELRADIGERGVQSPLELTPAGLVLDGRQRLRLARELGIERVPVRVVEAEDVTAYVVRAALHRRHLDPSRRAALALELELYEQERDRAKTRSRQNLRQHSEVASLPPRGEKTRAMVARLAGVSERTAQDAITVREHDPELFQLVKQGRVAAERAARRVRQRLRDSELPPPPPLPQEPFEVIYADPPWQAGPAESEFAPENHYPTLPLEEIKALTVPAAEDAVLFLWAVNALLPQALEVLGAWGFHYVANLVWVKERIGPGNWLRQRHELLLVGRRGDFATAERELRQDSVIEAPRRRHSEKPPEAQERIERMYPQATRVELFARRPRTGWVGWGNELPS